MIKYINQNQNQNQSRQDGWSLVVILIVVGVLIVGSLGLFFFSSNRRAKIEDLLQQKQGGDKLKTEVLFDIKNRLNTSLRKFIVSSNDEHYAYATGPTNVEFALFVPPESFFVDGRKIGSRENFMNFTFSPDGKHFAYGIYTSSSDLLDSNYILVLNGRKIDNYSGYGFIFSPDSQHLAYLGSEEGTGKAFIILDDNKVSKEYPEIRRLLFSPNSRYLLYEVVNILNTSDNSIVVLDTKKNTEQIYQLHQSIDNISFSSNGEVAYTAKTIDGKKEYLIRNNRKTDEIYDEIELLTFSPDGNQLAYMVKENNNDWFIVLNGKKVHGPFNVVRDKYGMIDDRWEYGIENGGNIVFSADSNNSNKIHYSYRTPDAVIIDDQKFKIPKEAILYFIKFSLDYKHFAYLIQESCKNDLRWCYSLAVDGTIVDQYNEGKFNSISFPHFSADGKYFIFYGGGRDEVWRIVEEIEH